MFVSSRARGGYLAGSLFIVLMLAWSHVAALQPPTRSPSPASTRFVSLQRQALLPGYRSDPALDDMPRYRMVATVDLEMGVIQGQQEVRFANSTEHPLEDVALRLLPNATSIYGGGSLWVERATREGSDVSLTPLPTDDETVLRLPLDPPLAPAEWVTVHLTFSATIPDVGAGAGYGIYSQSAQITSLAGWYPILAPLGEDWDVPPVPPVGDANYFQASLYDVTLRVADGQTVVSSGVTRSTYQEGDAEVWHLVSGPAREFAVAISDRFVRLRAEIDGVTVNYYALAPLPGTSSAEDALTVATDALAAYVRRFGPYPFTEVDVVESPVSIGGYEFPGMVLVEHGLRAYGDPSRTRFIVAHEVAHQWWYAQVGSNPIEEPWLDESLATYSAAIYLEDTHGEPAAQGMLAYFRQEGGAGGGATILSPSTAFGSWAAYRMPVYYRGALFLHALRGEMGEEAFSVLLTRYATEYRFRTATTADFLRLAEEAAGRELDGLYLTWFGSDTPGS